MKPDGERMAANMKKRALQSGFTLIELLMVLVIMSLITIAFLENQSKFGSSTIMRSLAYQVALSLRQAQVYGTSVVQSGGTFGPTFGISIGASPNTYTLFSDTTAPPVDERDPGVTTVKTFAVQNSYSVQEVCAQAGVQW